MYPELLKFSETLLRGKKAHRHFRTDTHFNSMNQHSITCPSKTERKERYTYDLHSK